MPELSAKVELADVFEGLGNMRRRAELGRDFFIALKPDARSDLAMRRHQRKGPSGAWPPPSRKTRVYEAKRDLGGRFMQGRTRRKGKPGTLGKLTRSWSVKADDNGIHFLSKVPWADVHNSGGIAGKGARMPKREFGYFSPEFVEHASRKYVSYVVAPFDKGGKS